MDWRGNGPAVLALPARSGTVSEIKLLAIMFQKKHNKPMLDTKESSTLTQTTIRESLVISKH